MCRYGKKVLFFFLVLLSFGCGEGRCPGYIIGIDPSWSPLEAAGQEPNLLAFSIELLTTIAEKEDLHLSVIEKRGEDLLQGLDHEHYDGILSSMYPYRFRKSKYAFSEPYLLTGPVYIAPKSMKNVEANAMIGKEIGVINGSTSALLLQTLPGVILQGYDTAPELLEGLRKEEVDLITLQRVLAQKFVSNLYADSFKILETPLNDAGLRLITLSEKDPMLIEKFDRGFAKLSKKGEVDRLLRKWGLAPDGKQPEDLSQKIEIFLKSRF